MEKKENNGDDSIEIFGRSSVLWSWFGLGSTLWGRGGKKIKIKIRAHNGDAELFFWVSRDGGGVFL